MTVSELFRLGMDNIAGPETFNPPRCPLSPYTGRKIEIATIEAAAGFIREQSFLAFGQLKQEAILVSGHGQK